MNKNFKIQFNPFKILGISQESSIKEARDKFIDVLGSCPEKNKPVYCLAFDMICNKSSYYVMNGVYSVTKIDEFFCVNTGNLKLLKKLMHIKKNKYFLKKMDDLHRTLLYLAARNGFKNIVEYLIKIGVDLNSTQSTGSTPLHAAAFYGHKDIVKLLIDNGANPNIKNNFNNDPAQEGATNDIKEIIYNTKDNQILNLYYKLCSKKLVSHFIPIYGNNEDDVICYKLICNSNIGHLDRKNYVGVWHGTKFQCLESIVEKGLKPSGTKISNNTIIEPREGHIELNITFDEISNFAQAVFVSPSPNYSSSPAYAEIIEFKNKKYACLVEGRVKQGSYTKHRSTINRKIIPYGEPSCVEFRISEEHLIDLFVTSIVFISVNFIDNVEDYKDTDNISETDDEMMKTSESYWTNNI